MVSQPHQFEYAEGGSGQVVGALERRWNLLREVFGIRIASLVVFAVLFGALVTMRPAIAQNAGQIMREAARLSQLVDEGNYGEGTSMAGSRLEGLRVWRRPELAALFLPYAVRLSVETGKIKQASELLDSAETLLKRFPDYSRNEPVLVRERAEFYYASGRFEEAASAAAKAYQLSKEHGSFEIRSAYCRSLQALALIRLGKTSESEELALSALKTVPNDCKCAFFAPRILYAAGVVESQLGKKTDAEKLCDRGFNIASHSKLETRDLVLGHLAFAEIRLAEGDLARSEDAANQGMDLTERLFGTLHQDRIAELAFLAAVDLKKSDREGARARLQDSVKIAKALFGEGSAGAAIPARALHDLVSSSPQGIRP